MTTPFADIRDYMALPRLRGIRLAPAGDRLIATVQVPNANKTKYGTALWQLDPGGVAAPVRLTRSAPGESGPAFLPDGSVLFTSRRRDPDRSDDKPDKPDDEGPALWLLPAGGGEARLVAARPGGISDVAVAPRAGTVVFASATLPGAADDDAERRKARKDAKVSAILHETYPVRYWDHDLGPAEVRLFAAAAPDPGGEGPLPEPRDLTPQPGRALDEESFVVTPDGSTVLTGWAVPEARGARHTELVAIDVATGTRRTLLAEPGRADYFAPRVSPDGRMAVCIREAHGTTREPPDTTLWLVPLDAGDTGREARDLLPGFDLWPTRPAAWSPDSRLVYFVADQRGRRPVFGVDVTTGAVTRLTGDDGAYDELQPSPDGRYVYALRAGVAAAPCAVRIDAATGEIAYLDSPGTPIELPGRVEEVAATADDGTEIRGWLVLPDEPGSPAPLLLWVHGGPYMSWNDWSWRWSPWVMAARGYAVVLPDPALSTGYGQDMLRRGHGRWGPRTFADLMTITDAVVARDDIDETRTAMMGGSFGGYMANWIAGHTDRFRAIVSHAGLWNLPLEVTADVGDYFIREHGDPADDLEPWNRNSPHLHARRIRTPMLVIHGDRDYRVPIANALWQWFDLVRNEATAKFLYFPDENHWILTPGNAAVWYETVLAFLAHHVLGEEWKRPELL
ncbi:MAG TPA: S9 family peptidase [Streptosporangiaceae bacterium]|nr:S9 family peptidase [Streptosporangiaceae bacterium]